MIPLFRPSVGEEEINALRETFKTGWLGLGPKTAEFEKKFAEYIGTKHAVGMNSCTATLDLALRVNGFKEGEVLIPAITFVSTAHAALYNNLKPVFVDVNPETFCIDIEDMKEKITNKTKAIIPVHVGGHPCDMDPIMEIAKEKNLLVIEDVANATGGRYKGRKLGGIGDVGCFSFEAKKNMTTGDGGMLTTNNDAIIDTLKRLRWVGINKGTWERASSPKYSWRYDIDILGYKYNMNDIQAAMGLVQLAKLDRLNEKRRKIAEFYRQELSKESWLKCPKETEWAKHVYWLFILKVAERDNFIEYMAKNGVTAGVHFMPIPLHPLYKKFASDIPIALDVWKSMVDIPIFPDITEADMRKVVSVIKDFK